MPAAIPQTVRDVLGQSAADDLTQWFTDAVRETVGSMTQYDDLSSTMEVFDEKLTALGNESSGFRERIDTRFEQIDERFEQIDTRFEQIDTRLEGIDGRLEAIDGRLDRVETRLDRNEGHFLEMHTRLDRFGNEFLEMHTRLGRFDDRLGSDFLGLHTRLDHFNDRFERIYDGFERVFDRILTMTRWTVGTIALIGTLIAALLAVAQFG